MKPQNTFRFLLIALLSAVCASPTLAQTPQFPDMPPEVRPEIPVVTNRPPVVLVPNQEGDSEPIHVRTVDVDVRIDGFLAETTVVMTFHNPNPRILGGELVFPLPQGATISGFGLDVGGELVDGVVVERQAARVAFEAEMNRRVDPGLAEWAQGSVFRTRVYPLPAEGGRTIKLSYVTDLTTLEGSATYHLPMAYTEPLEQLDLRVAVSRGAAQPQITSGGLGGIEFASWETQWVAETSLTDVAPSDDLVVAVPMPESLALVEVTGEGDRYFALVDVLPELEPPPLGDPIESAVILFDASASRLEADLDAEMAVVEAWANAHPDIELHVVVFRDRLESAIAIPEGSGRGSRIVEQLRAEPLDGGTDMAPLTFPADLRELVASADPARQVDAYLLLGDGLGTLGEPERVEPGARVYAISSTSAANHGWLTDIAERSGGMAINLQRTTAEQAAALLESTPIRLAAIEYEPGSVEAIETVSRVPRDGRMIVAGRLLADQTTIRLTYRAGSATWHQSEVTVRQDGTAQAGVVSTFWAQLRLQGLALAPERNRVGLLRLGREFNLVTPQTSYIVLETLEQHLEHGIPPAETRTSMFTAFNEQIEQREVARRESREAKLSRVAQWWAERVAWYERTVATPTPSLPGTPGTPGTLSTAPADEPVWDEQVQIQPSRQLDSLALPSPSEPSPSLDDGEYRDDVAEVEEEAWGMEGDGVAGGAPARSRRESGSADFGASAGESRAGPSGSGRASSESSGEEGGGGTIAVQAWSPDTPYMTALAAVDVDAAYGVYLDQRSGYERSPAFYLDVASLLYQKDQNEEARRVLTNIAELGLADARLMRIVAYKLQEEGDIDLAIRLFEEVRSLRPDEPQSSRDLALALAARADEAAAAGGDAETVVADWARAVELLSEMIGNDTGRFEQIEMPSIHEANRIIARMERFAEAELGGAEALPDLPLDPRLRNNLELDVRVLLRWDTDQTDMDLWVDEPSGERAWYQQHNTGIGGLFGRDYTGGYGPEEYVLREAPDGSFTISANFYGSRAQELTGGTTLQVDIFTDYGRATERRQSATIRLTSSGETVVIGRVAFEDGGPAFDIEEGLEVSGN